MPVSGDVPGDGALTNCASPGRRAAAGPSTSPGPNRSASTTPSPGRRGASAHGPYASGCSPLAAAPRPKSPPQGQHPSRKPAVLVLQHLSENNSQNAPSRPPPAPLPLNTLSPDASLTLPQRRPASPAGARCSTAHLEQQTPRPFKATHSRLSAPPTHVLGVDVRPLRHQRLRHRRVAFSSRQVQGRRSLRRDAPSEACRRLTCLTAARPRDAAIRPLVPKVGGDLAAV